MLCSFILIEVKKTISWKGLGKRQECIEFIAVKNYFRALLKLCFRTAVHHYSLLFNGIIVSQGFIF